MNESFERQYSVLVVDDDQTIRDLLRLVLRDAGYAVLLAEDGEGGLRQAAEALPDLIISDVEMPTSGLSFVSQLRRNPRLRSIPVMFLSAGDSTAEIAAALTLGADDYIAKPFENAELLARVAGKLRRPPTPRDLLPFDPASGLLGEVRFAQELGREYMRFQRGGQSGALCRLTFLELPGLELRYGSSIAEEVFRAIIERVVAFGHPLDLLGRTERFHIQVLMPDTDAQDAVRQLNAIATSVAAELLELDYIALRLTPAAGLVTFDDSASQALLEQRAREALAYATAQGDLRPALWTTNIGQWAWREAARAAAQQQRRPSRWVGNAQLGLQLAIMVVLGNVLPYIGYVLLDDAGYDISGVAYIVVVIALATTAALIWIEGFYALGVPEPPEAPGEAYPMATAVIAAYLPNEAATILATIETFLRIDYPGELEIILAYNTPFRLAVESEFDALMRREPRFRALRIEQSESKAQNINAALALCRGRFVGIFDADHHPRPEAFTRAWRWLSNGYDVVQGHCLVRNGASSFIARMVAVEFESIYAVAHPGRSRFHGFGLFGGSNGFWRTDRLHQVRMRSSMLTEDIDSTLRVIAAGGRIATDPGLVSTELATTRLREVWNQRMRWAQGWFQVSLSHYVLAMRSPALSIRSKLGMTQLLVWREVYPWISLQMFPLIAFWLTRRGGFDAIDWFVPIFVLTTLFTLSVGPGEALFAYWRADPEVGRHRRWFWTYLVFAIFYNEFLNTIARVAQLREFMGQHDWRVTPREAERPGAGERLVREVR